MPPRSSLLAPSTPTPEPHGLMSQRKVFCSAAPAPVLSPAVITHETGSLPLRLRPHLHQHVGNRRRISQTRERGVAHSLRRRSALRRESSMARAICFAASRHAGSKPAPRGAPQSQVCRGCGSSGAGHRAQRHRNAKAFTETLLFMVNQRIASRITGSHPPARLPFPSNALTSKEKNAVAHRTCFPFTVRTESVWAGSCAGHVRYWAGVQSDQ